MTGRWAWVASSTPPAAIAPTKKLAPAITAVLTPRLVHVATSQSPALSARPGNAPIGSQVPRRPSLVGGRARAVTRDRSVRGQHARLDQDLLKDRAQVGPKLVGHGT